MTIELKVNPHLKCPNCGGMVFTREMQQPPAMGWHQRRTTCGDCKASLYRSPRDTKPGAARDPEYWTVTINKQPSAGESQR